MNDDKDFVSQRLVYLFVFFSSNLFGSLAKYEFFSTSIKGWAGLVAGPKGHPSPRNFWELAIFAKPKKRRRRPKQLQFTHKHICYMFLSVWLTYSKLIQHAQSKVCLVLIVVIFCWSYQLLNSLSFVCLLSYLFRTGYYWWNPQACLQ